MRILNEQAVDVFSRSYPRAAKQLERWKTIVRNSSWQNFAELRGSFNSADCVQGFAVFNIAGNHYRLITVINYSHQIVTVTHVLTHHEYDRGNWK